MKFLNIPLIKRRSMNPNTKLNKNNHITNTNTNDDYVKPLLMETYIDAFASSIEFYTRVNRAFINAFSVPLTDAREELIEIKKETIDGKDLVFNSYDKQQEFYNKSEKIILSKIRNKFDTNFREKTFVTSLSELIKSYCELAKISSIALMYQYISNVNSFWNTGFIKPLRDVIYRTPSHKIHSENKYSLFHYDLPQENNYRQKKDEDEIVKKGI